MYTSYPYALLALLGSALWELSDDLSGGWKVCAIILAAIGQALLAYAVARWLFSRKSIQHNKRWTVGLWIAFGGAASAIAFAAGENWAIVREPDNWLVVECRPLKPRNVETHFHDTFYLLDASPNASGEIQKVEAGSSQKGNLERRLQGAHWNKEKYSYLDYVLLYSISNQGLRLLSDIELPVQISYSEKDKKTQDDHDKEDHQKEIRVSIPSLSPGETFSLVIFSTNSQFYSRLDFPDFISLDNVETTLPARLRVNYHSDVNAQSSVVSGPRPL